MSDWKKLVKLNAKYAGTLPVVYGTCWCPGTLVYLTNRRKLYFNAADPGDGRYNDPTQQLLCDAVDGVVVFCEGTVTPIKLKFANDTLTDLTTQLYQNQVLRRFISYSTGCGNSPYLVPSDIIISDNRTTPVSIYTGTTVAGQAHVGVCHMRAVAMRVGGDTATTVDVSLFATGRCAGYGTGGYDCLPGDVIRDLLERAGVDGAAVVTATGIDGTAASSYDRMCLARQWFISLRDDADDKLQLVESILQATDSTIVAYDGKIHVLPLCDEVVTGGGYTFTPYATPITLDDDELLRDGDSSPVTVERTSQQELYNCVPVSYQLRTRKDETAVAEYTDGGHSSEWTLRRASTVDLPLVISQQHVFQLAFVLTQRALFCQNQYTFKLSKRWSLLTPTDFVSVQPGIGLPNVTCRIESVDEEPTTGELTVTAREWPVLAQSIDITPDAPDGISDAVITPDVVDMQLLSVPDEAVTTRLLAELAVTTANIAAGAVTGPKIATGAVGTDQLAAACVSTLKLAAGAVGPDQLATSAVTATKLATDAVGSGNLQAECVGATALAALSVTAAKIAASTITADKLVTDCLKTSNYAQDGSGNPTAGAKLDHTGTALKVAPANFQVGPLPFTHLVQMGNVTINGTSQYYDVTLPYAYSDILYRVQITPSYYTGAPPIGAFVPIKVNMYSTYFRFYLYSAPGTGNSVAFNWSVMHDFP